MFDFLTYIPLFGGFLSVAVPFVIALGAVVFVHEYGHYIVGRWCGIHAEAFSMGFGKVLYSWYDKRGTKWQISALPLGGYVKFLGDANGASGADQEALAKMPDDVRSKTFHGAKLYKKALTVFAGPATNFIFSIIVFSLLTIGQGVATNEPVVGELTRFPGIQNDLQEGDFIKEINGKQISTREDIGDFLTEDTPTLTSYYLVDRDGREMTVEGPYPWLPIVAAVTPVTPAAKAGLQKGDLILAVGDTEIRTFPQLQKAVRSAAQAETSMRIQRGSETLELVIEPRLIPYENQDGTFTERVQIGIAGGIAFGPEILPVPLWEAPYYGYLRVKFIVQKFLQTIGQLFTGGISPKNLQGPLGIAVASGDTASQGLAEFIYFVGFVSTAIGLMNLLPIPVLDGGHLIIFAYQAVFRREPNEKVLNVAMAIGFSFLIGLMLYATFNDGLRLL